MAVYAIGDLHLALGCDKPMDVFPGWEGYIERLESNWRSAVGENDVVVLAGDTSWAMKLENCEEDFAFLQSLPGKKLMIKGNHDYWWCTRKKMESFITEKGFLTLGFIHNDACIAEGLALCGTRSWGMEPDEEHDEKVMLREEGRLRASLEYAKNKEEGAERIAFLHYPPINASRQCDGIVKTMKEYGVKQCFYGHLHGNSLKYATQGNHDGITYKLISADALGFCPVKIN